MLSLVLVSELLKLESLSNSNFKNQYQKSLRHLSEGFFVNFI